ncbi:MAG: 6,7-dimethyl-8-ribityllumazine synthase [Betaproteobacteria bacterium]|jgi:6,7-dimethyl-8-ribityllumazine synthase|nr:MAG: 6,7-dimethyl-8-ribityllumazine synthase [Betaproteobacteria bacterium]
MALDTIAPDLDGAGLRIGIVRSRFNAWAGEALLESCVSELRRLGVDDDDVTHVTVPGALEVPVALSKLAQAQDYDALIALGCVIRGDTFHFEVVATESAHGISRVALEHGIPVANAVLTTENEAQARERIDEKGREAARVAVEMANLMWSLEEGGEDDGAQ